VSGSPDVSRDLDARASGRTASSGPPARKLGRTESSGPPARKFGRTESSGPPARAKRPGEAADAELVRRALGGDAPAFGELVERYQGLLMLIAYRRTGRPSDCEDVVQDAFVRAYRALHSLEDPARFRSWVAQIASNVALDRVRRRSPTVSFDQDSGVFRAMPPQRGPRPATWMETEDERARLIEAIEKLPEIYQVPVVLRYLEGMSYRDMSKRLGVREDALRKRVHRANEMLHGSLAAKPAGPDGAG
jgi:RNA polymerase sigma-70 factor (ECF subfamily)